MICVDVTGSAVLEHQDDCLIPLMCHPPSLFLAPSLPSSLSLLLGVFVSDGFIFLFFHFHKTRANVDIGTVSFQRVVM